MPAVNHPYLPSWAETHRPKPGDHSSFVEQLVGLEPTDGGFADLCVIRFATVAYRLSLFSIYHAYKQKVALKAEKSEPLVIIRPFVRLEIENVKSVLIIIDPKTMHLLILYHLSTPGRDRTDDLSLKRRLL